MLVQHGSNRWERRYTLTNDHQRYLSICQSIVDWHFLNLLPEKTMLDYAFIRDNRFWTKELLLKCVHCYRPKIRCTVERHNLNDENIVVDVCSHNVNAEITETEDALDGYVWLTCQTHNLAMVSSWDDILKNLNDRYSAPIEFVGQHVEFHV